MPRTKPIQDVVNKWQQRAAQATPDYEQGIRNPKEDWATATGAAEESYAQGVQTAITEGRFGRGVQEAGTQKWQRNALEKGTQRWSPGVQAARPDYEREMAQVLNTIQATTLSPRYPRGDPRNYERVRDIGDALHEMRTRGG